MSEVKLYNGDCLEVMKSIPDGGVDLVVADPPYFKVANEEWDRKWRTEENYLEWSLEWIGEAVRVLRYGGSFYCFGYFRTLALLVPHFEDLGLELRQQIIISKGMRSVSGRATRNYRMFPNTTESVLFATKDNRGFLKPFLKGRQAELGLTSKQINDALGVKSNGGGMWSIYTGKNVCEQFPTANMWNKLSDVLKFDIPYGNVSQTFNPQMGCTDVWTDIDFYKEKRFHPTQKPLKLIQRIVSASSNEGDIVLDPFVGGGSTGIACVNTNRNFIGIELDEKYFEIAEQRINNARIQTKLF